MRYLGLFIFALLFASLDVTAQGPGSQDLNFFSFNSANNNIWGSAVQSSDNKILIGGDFTMYGYDTISRVARLHENGMIDKSFDVGTGPEESVYCILAQEDGKIMIGGKFVFYNNEIVGGLARLNEDGSLDQTFHNELEVAGPVWTIERQSDGKYLVGGDFYTYGATIVRAIMRLNTDGTIDDTFTSEVPNSWVRAIDIQSDGKILLGGDFTVYSGNTVNYIVRVLPDGSYDDTFVSGTGFDDLVRDMDHLPDGRIYVTGGFNTYNGVAANDIVRLYPDGTLDETFDIGTGPKGWIVTCALRQDGKIFIGGDFTKVGTTDIFRLACLNENGTLDQSFQSGDGPDNSVRNVLALADGKALITGLFTDYDGIPSKRICRVFAAPLGTSTNPVTNAPEITLSPNPIGPDEYIYFNSPGPLTVHISSSTGSLLDRLNFYSEDKHKINMSGYPSGIYFFEFIQGNTRTTSKVIKN